MLQVTKRDGRVVQFDHNKITAAILNAFMDVDGELSDYAYHKASNIADYIASIAENAEPDNPLTIEEIQDYVEKGLMATKRKDVAKSYILFRDMRKRRRFNNDETLIEFGKKLCERNDERQNANVDGNSFGGRQGEAAAVFKKRFALDNLMTEKMRYNHLHNRIYIHDLDSYAVGMHNCLSVPFDDLLATGFNTRQTDVRPANSINTAFQLVAVIFQLQSLQQFGGVSATHLDWTMVPYVRKSFYKHYKNGLKYINESLNPLYKEFTEKMNDATPIDEYTDVAPKAYQYAMDMTEREVYQAVEGMYHNLNTLQSRSGNQLPFTSINYGTCTLPEGRMVIKALLEGSIKGVGKFHKTSIFPCGIFQCMKGVNLKPGDANYDLFQLALKSTSQRMYPNYANVDWSGNAGYDVNDPCTYFSTMGCRTANGYDVNGFGLLKDGRGNIAPSTIILPTLAMEAKEKCKDNETKLVDTFMEILDQAISDCKDGLIERFEHICSQSADSATFQYENGTMKGYIPEEGIRSALKHGTLAIGQLGLAETLQILLGCDHTEDRGMALAHKIEQLFEKRCKQFKEKYKLNFGVYYTPKLLGLGVA